MGEKDDGKKRKIEKLTLDSGNYPHLLRFIKNPPEELYCSGRIELLGERCFAVVGTRKPTEYGKWAAFKIGERLAESGITVVSGMAAGIDTMAHKGALAAGGNTIAVFGTGLDQCFPSSNRKLKAEIEEKGLIVSEYPDGYPSMPHTFPQRNRIVSGISEGVIVVEAALKSGSLITAELAGEQGRMVYAVPGNINNVMSIGANKLIHDGASAIAVIDDLIFDLGLNAPPSKGFTDNLAKDEIEVLNIVKSSGEITIDMLCSRLHLPPGKVIGIVTVLEMKGIVASSLGKIFLAK